MTYTIIESDNRKAIKRDNADGTTTIIPFDLTNSDYQRYLAWLENPEAEQSTPNLAD